MNHNVKKIVRCIINAQIASDGGKGIFELARTKKEWAIARDGYAVKDWYISEAIGNIQTSRNCGIFYHVEWCPELSGWDDCYIVYFNIKLSGKRYQISFHCFNPQLENLTGSCKTRWVRRNGSRNAAKELRELIEA